jgi:hypothetical protein
VGYADPSLADKSLRQELQTALLGTALQFSNAVRRFERRCRQRGLDRSSRILLDQVHLSRSLLLELAREMSSERRGAARSGLHA